MINRSFFYTFPAISANHIFVASFTSAISFTIGVANLPAGADRWNCAFQDPSTGNVYQRSNLVFPSPPSSAFLTPSQLAPMSVPVSSGILSIGASAGTGGTTDTGIVITVIASYQINISVSNGGAYTFDFLTGKMRS
jgi:hypothetical protein